jgi:hypothetical protein
MLLRRHRDLALRIGQELMQRNRIAVVASLHFDFLAEPLASLDQLCERALQAIQTLLHDKYRSWGRPRGRGTRWAQCGSSAPSCRWSGMLEPGGAMGESSGTGTLVATARTDRDCWCP